MYQNDKKKGIYLMLGWMPFFRTKLIRQLQNHGYSLS
ncbi:hypothetical protein PGTDC60_2034 [Porphyromonas gingivalis TDC60]|uniref:Uncharacterized protein n=1 Tax=Porphyromonas gingivalis (strain ATCC BAA-308 / W83) TaxID=242619 RepID=Q7MUR4_PORGI|nr:hypothetical protein PG_1429 [Porphyromonas gingivalis W83]BAK26176.1 hypothetical protein PGTDC60_2034 [Porphyromonas gingivalis TDC60]